MNNSTSHATTTPAGEPPSCSPPTLEHVIRDHFAQLLDVMGVDPDTSGPALREATRVLLGDRRLRIEANSPGRRAFEALNDAVVAAERPTPADFLGTVTCPGCGDQFWAYLDPATTHHGSPDGHDPGDEAPRDA
jgi:hypothetical protein